MFFITFVAGGLAFYLLFGGVKPGPFEKGIMDNLRKGKRVIVSIDNDAYIFEMNGNKLRITRGTADYMEEEYDPMVDSNTDQSSNNM